MNDRTIEIDALGWVISLALGRGRGDERPRDWSAVLRLAGLERCIGLCWLRSRTFIRDNAPPSIMEAWRREAMQLDDAARRQFTAVTRVVARLQQAGLRPIVLKGAPLAVRLYGDAFVRHSADVDLLVPPSQVAAADAVLASDGWTRQGSTAGERTYRGRAERMHVILELHDTLTDDELISHFVIPVPTADRIVVEGVALPTLPAALMPSYLALHLAKHTGAPLLWLLDLNTLWGTLDHGQRASAMVVARAHRAHRVLRWALERAAHLEPAARGDLRALERCGGTCALFPERHAIHINALAAPSVTAAAGLLARWTARRLRELGTNQGARTGRLRHLEQVAARLRGMTARSECPSAPTSHLLRLDVRASTSLLREVIASEASTWVVARGASMSPIIPSGSRVRVAPFGAEGPCPGDVGVMETPAGEIVMHRIIAVGEGTVQLRGDNMRAADRPVDRSCLIGIATHIDTPRGPRPIQRGVPGNVRRGFWRVQRRAARLLHAGGVS